MNCARVGCQVTHAVRRIRVYVAGGRTPWLLTVCSLHATKHGDASMSQAQFARAFGSQTARGLA